jgi:hypothetical protein
MRASAPIPDVTVARDDEQERRLGVLLLDETTENVRSLGGLFRPV